MPAMEVLLGPNTIVVLCNEVTARVPFSHEHPCVFPNRTVVFKSVLCCARLSPWFQPSLDNSFLLLSLTARPPALTLLRSFPRPLILLQPSLASRRLTWRRYVMPGGPRNPVWLVTQVSSH